MNMFLLDNFGMNNVSSSEHDKPPHRSSAVPKLLLALAALGIVFGDLGTSPWYALQEAFHGENGVAPTPQNVIGIVSLFLWSLIVMVSLKYVFVLMRADNRGEGGILALLVLLMGGRKKPIPAALDIGFILH